MKRIRGHVARGLARRRPLPMGTLFSPDSRETRLQRGSKLIERGIEIIGEKTVATHDVKLVFDSISGSTEARIQQNQYLRR